MVSHLFDHDLENGLDNTKFPVPESMRWGDFRWTLLGVPLFSGSRNRGHYKALVREHDGRDFRMFDDDCVSSIKRAKAISALKTNKHGLPYGLIYVRDD